MPTWNRRTSRRAAVTAGVVLGHVLVLWLMIAGYEAPAKTRPDTETGASIGMDLVGTAPTAAAKPPSRPALVKPKPTVALDPVVSETPAPQPDPAITDVSYTLPAVSPVDSAPVLSDADAQALSQFQPAAAQAGAGQACNLTPAVVRDFSQSPVVRQGVAELPASEKSVANAVQMWDGTWAAETQSGGKALLRALLTREITAAPANCRSQVNTGPVFFMVPDGAATVVVAVGSGQWNWGQLVE